MAKSNRKIYLDYAAGVEPNSGAIHQAGVQARQKLENARQEAARILAARPAEIIFTSGGTEGNNLAIQGTVYAARQTAAFVPHIVTTNIEHSSVLETCRLLAKRGLAQVSYVPVAPNGIVDPKKIKKALRQNTVLVSVMYANNEIGTIQPIREIAKEIRHFRKAYFKKRIASLYPLFHTDAVQAANFLSLNTVKLGVDLLTLSGSKIEQAGRAGLLYKKSSIPFEPVWGGGDQEAGLRPGTENVSAISKFVQALSLAQKIKDRESLRLLKLRDHLYHSLVRVNRKIILNGDLNKRLPNNVNITIPGFPSELLLIELSERGVLASAKSACKSGDSKVSYVLQAINSEIEETDGALRFSFGRQTQQSDIDYASTSLKEILKKLEKWYN